MVLSTSNDSSYTEVFYGCNKQKMYSLYFGSKYMYINTLQPIMKQHVFLQSFVLHYGGTLLFYNRYGYHFRSSHLLQRVPISTANPTYFLVVFDFQSSHLQTDQRKSEYISKVSYIVPLLSRCITHTKSS